MITISNNGSNVICAWCTCLLRLIWFSQWIIGEMSTGVDVSPTTITCVYVHAFAYVHSVGMPFLNRPLSFFSIPHHRILEHIHVMFYTYTQNSDLQLSKTLNSARKSMFTSIRSTVQTTYHRLDFHKPICTISILINLKTLTINIFHSLTKSHPVAHSLYHTYCFDFPVLL